ncbi:MAG: MBG domain-containing protein [Mucilaginibacter sp.]|uniref:MBG domain-containing protein n=1 Tax=Mucilaginibacter sp. TaxID=1882438 RepID=UPI0031AEBE55
MKKLLLVFCITLSFVIPGLRAHAQTTIDWSCFTTASTLITANDIATLQFTNANCPAANGYSLQAVGTGQLSITFAIFNGVGFVRTTRNAAAATTLNYARFFRTSGGAFALTGISVSPTAVTPAAGGNQSITLHAYRNGVEVGSTSTGTLSVNLPVAIPSAQLSAFANIDEVRFTSSSGTVIGIGYDDIVVTAAANAPTVTTTGSSAVTANSATLTGNVSSDGGATVSDKGIVYGLTTDPTIANTKLANGNGTGAISVNASGLAPNTPYHYRAYATNTIGTTYGVDKTFTTLTANHAPVALADNYTYTIGTPLVIAAPGVLNNDTDGDGDAVTAIKVTNPTHGTVTLNANGSFTYTPSGNTADSFTYKVNDGTVDGNTVTVTLSPANVAPVAAADNYTYSVGVPLIVATPGLLNNDTDGNGDALTAVLVTGAAHGGLVLNPNGSFVYTPSSNTADSFTYKANDGTVSGNTVTVTLSPANVAPVAVADNYVYTSGTPLVIAAPGVLNNDTDGNGDALTAVLITGPTHGNLTLNPNGSFTYTPSGNTNDSFTYKASDGMVIGNTVTVTLTHNNSNPVANNDTYTTNENTAKTGNVLSNDTDPDGDSLTASLVTAPVNGTIVLNADGSFTYTPNNNYSGSDSFLYQVCDNGVPSLCDTGTVTLNISSVNQAPVLALSGSTPHFTGSAVAVDNGITITDADNTTLATATVSITGNLHSGEDRLVFTPGGTGNITGNYTQITGTLFLSSAGSTASIAEWQTALRGVTYQDVVVTPNTATRSITFSVNDGSDDSAPVTKSVTISSAVISTTGTLSVLTTTYGTASSSGTFNVSGVALGSGILVTAPTGFEVSTDNTTFTNTVTVGSAGTIASTPLYIRLAAGTGAGNYSGNVVLSATGAANVNVPTVASTVNPKALTVTATAAQNKTYGNIDPTLTYAITSGTLVGTDTFTGSLSRVAGENAGTYAILQGNLALSSNYILTYVGANYTINKAAITVTADAKNKVYGNGDPILIFHVTNGSLKFADTFSGSLTRAPGENVGTYAIQQGGLALSSNYVITYVPATLTVTPAALTITANNKGKAFGQTLTGGPGSTDFTSSGLVGTETIGSVTITYGTGAAASAPANTYTGSVVASAAIGGTFDAGNYNITYVAGNIVVGQAILTITANDANKVYGAAIPALSVTYSGFVGTDDPSSLTTQPTLSTTATTNSPVNTYAITASGAVSANYTIVYNPGTLTVTPAPLTITANDANKVYGAAVPALSVNYSGFVGTDDAASLTTQPTLSTTATTNSPVNTYPITASGAASANYIFIYKPGTLTVTPAALTITANDANKVYGAAIPALSVSYSGFVGTDDATSLTTQPALNTTAVVTSPANTYPITASGAVSANYTITYQPGTLTVTPAALTIKANDANKVYGAAVPALSVSYSGFVGTDNAASLTTQPTIISPVTVNSPVNTYPITAGGAASANYTFTYVPGTFTVTPAVLTITANDANKVYGAAVPALSVSYSGFAGTDNAASLTTAPTITTTAVANSPVNTYPITASGAVSANYTFVYQPGTLTVIPAALTITANNKSKAFGQTLTGGPGSADFTSSGLIGSETIGSVTITYGTGAAATAPANTYTGSVVASAATGGTFSSGNYSVTYVAGNIVVGQAVLTITANDANKVYGATNPTLSVSYSGFVGTDDASSLTTQPIISTTAVTNSPVNTYPITVSGAASSNYSFVYNPGTLTVNKATLTVTANNKTKTYGTTNPVLTVSYSGFVGTDDASSLTTAPAITTTAVDNSPVNTYPITASGAVAANYTFVYKPGVLTVTKAVLNITANNTSKTYGTANPAFTVSYAGFAGTDDASSLITQPAVSSTATTNSPVNTYPITASGAASANYTFVYKPGILTITKATLTITANNANKTYGGINPALSVSYSGFKGTDNDASLTTKPTASTTAVTTSPVGTYPITASGAASTNYTFVYKPGILTIGKAVLTITANNATKVYGSVNPALSVSYSGFTGTDNASSLSTAPIISTTAVTGSPVNTYPITATGAASPNYSFVYKPGILTVTKAVLTITANDANKIYGTVNPVLSVSYSGFVGTDKPSCLITPPTVTTTAVTTSPVDTYPITAKGAVASNYSIVYKPGVLTVTKAVLTITAKNATKVYGTDNPVLGVTYAGFAGTDNVANLTTAPTASTTAVTTSPVNTYPITASGAVAANYSFVYKPGILTVTKAVLTITADNLTKPYGTVNPTLTASYKGFVGTDDASGLTTAPTLSTTAVTNSPVNTYPITVGGAASPNYSFVYKPGILTVTQPVLTITANDVSKTYGSANPTLSVSYSGFVNGDNSSTLTKAPVITTAANTSSNAGTYPITISGAAIANYKIVYVAGTLTINKATLTVKVDNKTRLYGVSNPALTDVYSGFVNGDNEASLTTQPVVKTNATSTSAPGSYPITASDGVSANYNFNYVAGVLTVTPLSISTLNNLTLSAGTLSPSFATNILAYTAQVDNQVEDIRLTLTFDATATAKVNGTITHNGSPSADIPLNVGNNTITAVLTAQDGVTTSTYTVIVYRGESQEAIVGTNILTPNGDGKNDFWIVKDIQLFPNNTVVVYDKGGRTVFTKHGYTNDWNGTYGGSPLTEGTYYYSVDLGPGNRKFRGYITILRTR